MRFRLLFAPLASLAACVLAEPPARTEITAASERVAVVRLGAHTTEARAVLMWMREHTGEPLPALSAGVITVRRTSAAAPRLGRKVPDTPLPIPLPLRGAAGERISIERRLGRDEECWVFEWTTGPDNEGHWTWRASHRLLPRPLTH